MTAPRPERLTDSDLDGIARFGVAIESDQQALAAELLAYRHAARALVEAKREQAEAELAEALRRESLTQQVINEQLRRMEAEQRTAALRRAGEGA